MSNVGILTNKDKAKFKEAVVIVNRNIEICKDGGRGWIVCISAALVRFLVLRIYSRFGILYIVFLREYG